MSAYSIAPAIGSHSFAEFCTLRPSAKLSKKWSDYMKKNGGRRILLSKIRIVRGMAGTRLYIGNTHIQDITERHIDLVQCFLSNVGSIVPYEHLSTIIKWRGTKEGFRHCLRQYVHQIKMVFRANFGGFESRGFPSVYE